MSANKLEDIAWYADPGARERDEPGIYHSYMACVEGEIEMIGERLDDLVVEWDQAVLRNQLGVCPFGAPAYAAVHHRRKIRRHA